jgi:hypothetical protein
MANQTKYATNCLEQQSTHHSADTILYSISSRAAEYNFALHPRTHPSHQP